MITYKELLGSHTIAEVPIEHQHNLEDLLLKLNSFRAAYNNPMIITSGYRSEQEHIRIYSRKNIHYPNVPMGSSHLIGKACDFFDPSGSLMTFAKNNTPLLESLDLYCEDATVGWLHIQTTKPRSGSRFFKA